MKMEDSLLITLTVMVAGLLGCLIGIGTGDNKGMTIFCLLIAVYAAFTLGVKMVRLGIIQM